MTQTDELLKELAEIRTELRKIKYTYEDERSRNVAVGFYMQDFIFDMNRNHNPIEYLNMELEDMRDALKHH